jgi:hypothetical protein
MTLQLPLSLRRTFIIAVMLILLVSGQALALMHRVAHAKGVEHLSNIVCIEAEYACAVLPSGTPTNVDGLFGHERGADCLDFDAALGLDASVPATTLAYALPEVIAVGCFIHLAAPLIRSHGFSLARAPPRG